jgi:hypothetical protein
MLSYNLYCKSSSNRASFFKSSDPQDKELIIATKEATFAYHIATQDLRMADCCSQLISQLFNAK